MTLAGTSVYPRKDSPYWWIKYWCPKRLHFCARSSGHRRDHALGYERAVAMAREFSADAVAARSVAPNGRWECWVPAWLALQHHDSPKTLVSERNRWQWIDAFLTERKIYGPLGVTYQLGLDYIAARTSQVKRVSERHPSHNTALAELRLLSRVMREAVHREFAPANPLERMGIKRHRPPQKTRDE